MLLATLLYAGLLPLASGLLAQRNTSFNQECQRAANDVKTKVELENIRVLGAVDKLKVQVAEKIEAEAKLVKTTIKSQTGKVKKVCQAAGTDIKELLVLEKECKVTLNNTHRLVSTLHSELKDTKTALDFVKEAQRGTNSDLKEFQSEVNKKVGNLAQNVKSVSEKVTLVHDGVKVQENVLLEIYAMLNRTTSYLELSYKPADCLEVMTLGYTKPGGYKIVVPGIGTLFAYCSNGWTTFQRRQSGDVNFDRVRSDYTSGFGNAEGDVWLGLDPLHALTRHVPCRFRAELLLDKRHGSLSKEMKYVEAFEFSVGPAPGYRLTARGITSDLPKGADKLETYHSGMEFTTRDHDRDAWGKNCALHPSGFGGGWYNSGCWYINLNAFTTYPSSNSNRVRAWWYPYTLRGTELKFKC